MSDKLNIKSEPKTDSSDERPVIKPEPKIADQQAKTSEESSNVKQEPVSQSPSKPPAKATPAAAAAAGPQKRVFVPNLAVDRSKREVKQEPDQSKQDKNKQSRRPVAPNLNSSRGRGRNQNIIQSHSIFEAGPAESTKRFDRRDQSEGSYTRVVGSSDRSSNNTAKKEPEDPSVAHFKSEKNILIQDSKEDEFPVYIKLKYDVKDESNVLDFKSLEEAKSKDDKILKNIFQPENEMDKVLEKLVLFQLPEKLQLNELNEGHIGKIRIRKSGKIEMLVNDDKLLNVSLSVSAPFLQDAVGVEIIENEEKQESGKMFNLGHVMNKIVCSPQF